jgi:predicted glutamine amidotransferase
MCGIIATFGGTPIDDALKQYELQKSRGQDGFGFLALKGGHLVAFKRRTHERGIREEFEEVRELQPDAILFHHRFPTSTENLPDAAHPLPIKMKKWKHDYYMLHNGVVTANFDHGEDEIEKAGYRFGSRVEEVKYFRCGGKTYERVEDSSINDSEILGYYVAALLEGERKDIPVTGAAACIVARVNKKSKRVTVYAMRNNMNPLKVLRTKTKGGTTLLVSSENTGVNLDAHTIHELDLRSLTFSVKRTVDIGYNYTGESIGTYGRMGYNSPYSFGFADDVTPMLPMAKPDTVAPAHDADTLIAQELDRRTLVADQAYADYQEAINAFGEDDTVEAQAYIDEYRIKWEAAEELREELADDYDTIVEADTMKDERTGAMIF